MPLPVDAKERKNIPLYSGVIAYFPDALIEVAKISWEGNAQHNPGEPLHWAKEKSTDHEDCIQRHTFDALKSSDRAGRIRHMRARAWRALAALQIELETASVMVIEPGPVVPAVFCFDCGADLDWQLHAAGCLRGIGPRVG